MLVKVAGSPTGPILLAWSSVLIHRATISVPHVRNYVDFNARVSTNLCDICTSMFFDRDYIYIYLSKFFVALLLSCRECSITVTALIGSHRSTEASQAGILVQNLRKETVTFHSHIYKIYLCMFQQRLTIKDNYSNGLLSVEYFIWIILSALFDVS